MANKKKIGQITYSYKPFVGGAENYVKTLIDVLETERFEHHVYQAHGSPDDPEVKPVPVFNVPFISRKPLYVYNLLLNTKFIDLVKEDILIVHDPFHFWPVFWHKHNIVVSHGVRWDRPHHNDSLYNRVHRLSAVFAMRHVKKIVANDSNFFRQLGFDLPPKKKRFQEVIANRWFIPNCVDTLKFKKKIGHNSLKKLNAILVPRNIVRGRGIHMAIEAFFDFVQEFPETNLVIAGDFVDKIYQNYLFSLINKLNLQGKIYFLGSINNEDMPDIYSSSLMTVVPTLYEEGTSLAALESMACGTATVSTNVGGLPDLPTYQCDPNPASLARAMKYCLNNRERVAGEQQQSVISEYNLQRFKKAWQEVLEK